MKGRRERGRSAVQVTEHEWIPMPDGVRLAARLWRPVEDLESPVPAIFEYIPYRKADMVRARDERNHLYFAEHGYACLRVDMRGSGDSEGHMPDMYADHELSDARHVIEWIAAQPWCNGSVGMFGTSWGGTAALQANVDAPDPLKAIIAVCATHDRYEDDIHHMGGCLLTDTFEWGATLPAILAAPPTPNVGPDWLRLWRARLDQLSFPVASWVQQEARGAYWRHGSVIHQADALSRPVLAIGGWADRYSNSVMALVAARPDLVWGVVGPWGHHYPDQGHPGPAIGFQDLALDWWDRWLRPEGKVPDWPRLRLWLRDFEDPVDAIDVRAGQWITADATGGDLRSVSLCLGDGHLSETATNSIGGWTVPTDLSVGMAAGDTGYFGRFGGLPLDQRDDDERSLVFETDPLEEDMILLGTPRLTLEVADERREGQLAFRLNDVTPDGVSARVCFAVRNLALDDLLDVPDPVAPDLGDVIAVPFQSMAYRFRKGHRIRLSVSACYWPIVWPSPGVSKPCVESGVLTLPVLRHPPNKLAKPLPAVRNLPLHRNSTVLRAPQIKRILSKDLEGQLQSGWVQPLYEILYEETGTTFGYQTQADHRIREDDPNSAVSAFDHSACYRRPDGIARIQSSLVARCDRQSWHLSARLTADWNDQPLLDRNWDITIPRRLG